MDTQTPVILTAREAATLMRLSERTLLRLAADGRGPRRIRLTPGRIAYRRDDVLAWLAARAGEASDAAH